MINLLEIKVEQVCPTDKLFNVYFFQKTINNYARLTLSKRFVFTFAYLPSFKGII